MEFSRTRTTHCQHVRIYLLTWLFHSSYLQGTLLKNNNANLDRWDLWDREVFNG